MIRRRNTGRLYINCLVSLDLRTTKPSAYTHVKSIGLNLKATWGARGGEKAENSYLVLPQHIGIPISQVPTPLVVVHALDFLAFGEVVSNYASFHSLDPGLADELLARFESRCNVIEQRKNRQQNGRPVGCTRGEWGVGVKQVWFTFDERSFGFVNGHGEFEESEVGGGTEAPSGGIATWVSMASKAGFGFLGARAGGIGRYTLPCGANLCAIFTAPHPHNAYLLAI